MKRAAAEADKMKLKTLFRATYARNAAALLHAHRHKHTLTNDRKEFRISKTLDSELKTRF